MRGCIFVIISIFLFCEVVVVFNGKITIATEKRTEKCLNGIKNVFLWSIKNIENQIFEIGNIKNAYDCE